MHETVFMTHDMLRIMALENLFVAEPVFVHGNTVICFGKPSETDGGSVGLRNDEQVVELLRLLSRW